MVDPWREESHSRRKNIFRLSKVFDQLEGRLKKPRTPPPPIQTKCFTNHHVNHLQTRQCLWPCRTDSRRLKQLFRLCFHTTWVCNKPNRPMLRVNTLPVYADTVSEQMHTHHTPHKITVRTSPKSSNSKKLKTIITHQLCKGNAGIYRVSAEAPMSVSQSHNVSANQSSGATSPQQPNARTEKHASSKNNKNLQRNHQAVLVRDSNVGKVLA